ncbi:TadE family protein [Corticibacter populi]|uniref:TadE family protein n=1 Tax=Corticibacter populi TaxID=1550736 RepID=UPI0013C34B3D|nr:TadE family protein [Corticibacter populi]
MSLHRIKGAGMAEFIIVTPVAILLTFCLIQAGLLYMAKLTLNNAVFMAARHGATEHAQRSAIKESLIKGLLPFYVNALDFKGSEVSSLVAARIKAELDYQLYTTLEILSPSAEAFRVYGLKDKNNRTYIPNDNLEFRTATPVNGASISLRDANVLRIKVTYGYELKVPLMKAIVSRVMCPLMSSDSEVTAWKKPSVLGQSSASDCVRYYLQGRVPIVSFATVQMHTDPRPN